MEWWFTNSLSEFAISLMLDVLGIWIIRIRIRIMPYLKINRLECAIISWNSKPHTGYLFKSLQTEKHMPNPQHLDSQPVCILYVGARIFAAFFRNISTLAGCLDLFQRRAEPFLVKCVICWRCGRAFYGVSIDVARGFGRYWHEHAKDQAHSTQSQLLCTSMVDKTLRLSGPDGSSDNFPSLHRNSYFVYGEILA